MRWGALGKIALGWLFTLPAAAVVGGIAALVAKLGPVGLGIDAVVGLGATIFIFIVSQRERVDHRNAISEVEAVGGTVYIPSKKERNRLAAEALAAEKAAHKAVAKAAEKMAASARAEAAARAQEEAEARAAARPQAVPSEPVRVESARVGSADPVPEELTTQPASAASRKDK